MKQQAHTAQSAASGSKHSDSAKRSCPYPVTPSPHWQQCLRSQMRRPSAGLWSYEPLPPQPPWTSHPYCAEAVWQPAAGRTLPPFLRMAPTIKAQMNRKMTASSAPQELSYARSQHCTQPGHAAAGLHRGRARRSVAHNRCAHPPGPSHGTLLARTSDTCISLAHSIALAPSHATPDHARVALRRRMSRNTRHASAVGGPVRRLPWPLLRGCNEPKERLLLDTRWLVGRRLLFLEADRAAAEGDTLSSGSTAAP
jgi:hypothetical protein